MLGAIVGDIVGSVYERDGIKSKDFPLFKAGCTFTDDTVMTVAVAEGLLNGGQAEDFITAMKKYGQLYPEARYGRRFREWVLSDDPNPYYSDGNGAAMRVSPVAWAFDTLNQVEKAAALTASVTHNHPEGIKGAQATAAAIFLTRQGATRAEVREYIQQQYGYDLSRSLEEIRPDYKFYRSCKETVPEGVTAFLESNDFEDALRNAVSLGGDSDTLGAIAGSIAEAAYGVPEEIAKQVLSFLDERLLQVYTRFGSFKEHLCRS